MSIVERAIRKLQSQPGEKAPLPLGARVPSERTAKSHGAAPAPVLQPTIGVSSSVSGREHSYAKTVRLDKSALRGCGLLPPANQERLIANQYREIKRPLIANAIGKNAPVIPGGQLIMIASAVPGEGKTFTTVNLALSMAREKDLEVLLVDADVAKPQISSLFGLAKEPGLLDCLQDELLDIESLVVGTDVERLTILPAGRRAENATELLASARMEQIAAQLTAVDSKRIILFDSPPLLLTSESRVLANVVGQVVLIVRAASTAQQAVLDAISLLGEGKSIGLVLNRSEGEDGGRYYGYGEYASDSPSDEARDLQRS
jgi:protein-tyrosine kinase